MKGMAKGFNVKNRLITGIIFINNASKQIEKVNMGVEKFQSKKAISTLETLIP